MSLISWYVFRETFWSWLTVLAVLFAIFMSNQFADLLGDAAAAELPRDAVFAVFRLTSLRYLTILSPIALFLGIMLALARLNRDSEMAALLSCGIGPSRLLRPIGLLTVALAMVLAWLALFATPSASSTIERIRHEAEAGMDLGVLEPGRFSTPDAGRTVFHAERVDGEQIHDVFLQREIDGRVTVILAERGQRVHDETSGMLSFVLYDGRRYEGTPGELDYTIVEFSEHGIPIRDRRTEELVESPEMKRTSELLSSTARLDQTELQWRLSAPLSLFVLALLAVPLSHSRPREGRYARLGAGLLVYLIYANSLSMARIWVERGEVPLWFGMWWVHVGLGLLAVVLFARDSGWLIWRARSTSIRRIGA